MSSISQYLPYMNNAIAQKGQARANQYQGAGDNISQLLQALSAIAQKNQELQQSQTDQNNVNSALFQTTQTRQPQVNPSISPDMQSRGNQINDIAGFNAVGNAPTFQTRQEFNPTMERIAPLLTNPRTAPMVMSVLQGSKAMQGTTTQESPYENTIKTDAFGRRSVISPAVEKPVKRDVKYRTAMENGVPQTVTKNGITFTLQEPYDAETGQVVQGYGNNATKLDDMTAPKNGFADLSEKRLIKSYQQSFNSDPTIKAVREQGLSLGAVDSLIDQAKKGNQVSSAALGVKMAKVMGEVGMLSESDVTRYVQAKSLSQGGADILSKWMNGTPTNATLNQIQEIARVLRQEFKSKSQSIIENHVNQMATGMGMDAEEAKKYLSVESLFGKATPSNDIQIDLNDFENWRKGRK